MALAIDASTPSRVTGTGATGLTGTTAAFNPPASALVACCSGDGAPANTFSMTNNGAALTWAEIATRNSGDTGGSSGVAAAFYALLGASRTAMTVTYNYSSSNDSSMKLYVVTGADTSTPLGANTEGSSSSATTTTTAYTSTAANSFSFVVFNDFNAVAYSGSSDTTMDTGIIAGQISFGSGYKSLGAAGSSVTHNIQMASAPILNWVAFEIKPVGGAAPSLRPPGPRTLLQAVPRSTYW
jgi:hypothetical protein